MELVIQQIKSGACDGDLSRVQDALNQRRQYLESLAALEMEVGARIKVVADPSRPHATDDATGIVTKVARTKVHVELDQPRRGSTKWSFPASSLTRI